MVVLEDQKKRKINNKKRAWEEEEQEKFLYEVWTILIMDRMTFYE